MVVKQFRWALALLILCASTFAQADDCVSLLNAVAQPVIFPNLAAGPVAWTGSALGVIKNATDGSRAISFSLYDTELHQLSADRVVAATSFDRALAFLWNGSEFGLFYRNSGARLVLQRLAANGDPIGGATIVAPAHSSWTDSQYGVTWDPSRGAYLVVESIPQGADRGLWLIGVAPDGTVKLDQLINFFFARQPAPAVAVNTAGTVGIVWGYAETQDGVSLAFVTIDSRGNFSIAEQFGTDASAPRVATEGSGFTLVWSTLKSGGGSQIDWARASASGHIIAGESNLLVSKGIDAVPVALLWNPARSEWALTYLDGSSGFRVFPPELRLFRFTSNGALIGDALFSPDPTKNLLVNPYPVVWTGRSYVGGIERFISIAQGSDSYLVRHCPMTATMTTDTLFPAPGVALTFDATVSGGTPPLTYSWDFGDFNGTASVKSPRHVFVFAGDYTVTLTTSDATLGVSKSTLLVHVATTQPCPAIPPVQNVVAPPRVDQPVALVGRVLTFRVPFVAASGASYTWQFGDGSPAAKGDVVTHVFQRAGTYAVSYVRDITAANFCDGSVSGSASVRIVATVKRRAT
ncbi:MAG: PKD domain-containing protein [Acidobacteriota bacterium]